MGVWSSGGFPGPVQTREMQSRSPMWKMLQRLAREWGYCGMRKRRNDEEGGRGGQVEVGLEKRAVAKPWDGDGPEEHGDCRALYSSAE